MNKYAVLCNPGHNRVYFKSSQKLVISELAVASRRMAAPLRNIEFTKIAGMDYLAFEAGGEMCPEDIEILSGLSFIYAIYGIDEFSGAEYFKPIECINSHFVDESMSSILKYTGKTNELFTRMLINVANYSQLNEYDATQDIILLDPVAGKGTTLFEGLIKGFNVYGIEIGDKAAAEAYNFSKKFLETGKYKHNSSVTKISGPNKSFISKKYSFEIARTKDEQKENKVRYFEIIEGNSANARHFYKKNFFDIIVGDLPYGVQHGNVTNHKKGSLTRNPTELLENCLPAWVEVLKPGGAVALSWNVNVLPRSSFEQICSRCGLDILRGDEYAGFEHRVDQSIRRDVVVAVK